MKVGQFHGSYVSTGTALDGKYLVSTGMVLDGKYLTTCYLKMSLRTVPPDILVSFSKSQGDTVDSLLQASNALLAYGEKTAEMIGDLGAILKETASEFEKADNGIKF